MLFGEQDLVSALGIRAYPTYLLITPERNVEVILRGIDGVEELLGKKFGK